MHPHTQARPFIPPHLFAAAHAQHEGEQRRQFFKRLKARIAGIFPTAPTPTPEPDREPRSKALIGGVAWVLFMLVLIFAPSVRQPATTRAGVAYALGNAGEASTDTSVVGTTRRLRADMLALFGPGSVEAYYIVLHTDTAGVECGYYHNIFDTLGVGLQPLTYSRSAADGVTHAKNSL